MVLKISLIFLFCAQIFASQLQETYYVHSHNIKLRDVMPNAAYDVTIYQIEPSRYSKKVKSRDLLNILKKHGFSDLETQSNYVNFIKQSPIDTSKIREEIIKSYVEKYPDIEIKSLNVMPRAYMDSLPEQYEVIMQNRFYLSNSGVLSIKTLDKKKIFFNYTLEASLPVYETKQTLDKAEKISLLNTKQKMIHFDTFRGMPINQTHLNTAQSIRKLTQDTIITTKDIEDLNLVKRGSNVSVTFFDKNINISFSAKALQNGKLNDIITVQKNDQKKLKAKVIEKNRVEIQ
jgi:flagellar basal body P-ring formation protein FlgA